MGNVTIIVHFKVNTDAPVNGGQRTVDIEVRDSAFHDFGKNLACALVDRDTHLGFMARVEVLADDRGQLGGGNFVEGISLFFMGVGERNSLWVGLGHRILDGFVEKIVHRAVLSLLES
jgi:hypothetical protein